jgi:anion-transporting  ArsA/GET3 family ATPase
VVTVPSDSHGPVCALSSLLTKRLLFLIGKGGVGKTTIATALALAFVRQGKKTLLIEFDENARAAQLLGLPPLDSYTDIPRQVSPALFVMSASGQAALEEYLRLIIPVKRLLNTVFESRLYQYFVAAAPGLKELLTIGKVWYEERKREADTQQPRWDTLIVDTPASGHSLQYLRMPRAARDTFGSGIVHREAERILASLSDPEKTAISLVTTPEELPVSETREAYEHLVNDLRLPLGVLFINRVLRVPFSLEEIQQVRINIHAPVRERHWAEQVLACAQVEAAQAEAQAPYLQQLHQLPLPSIQIPLRLAEQFGLPEVEQISDLLATSMLGKTEEKGKKRKGAALRGVS